MSQKLSNLRYYDESDEPITLENLNLLIGASAKMVMDAGKELGGFSFTLKDVKKKMKEDGAHEKPQKK